MNLTTAKLSKKFWDITQLLNEEIGMMLHYISGVSEKEIVRNAQNRRYYIPKEVTQTYQAPHRK